MSCPKLDSGLPHSRTRSDLNLTRLPKECLPSFPMSHSTMEYRELKFLMGNKQKPEKKGMTYICVPAEESNNSSSF